MFDKNMGIFYTYVGRCLRAREPRKIQFIVLQCFIIIIIIIHGLCFLETYNYFSKNTLISSNVNGTVYTSPLNNITVIVIIV